MPLRHSLQLQKSEMFEWQLTSMRDHFWHVHGDHNGCTVGKEAETFSCAAVRLQEDFIGTIEDGEDGTFMSRIPYSRWLDFAGGSSYLSVW